MQTDLFNFGIKQEKEPVVEKYWCERCLEVSLLPRKHLIKNFPYLKKILEDDKTIVFRLE